MNNEMHSLVAATTEQKPLKYAIYARKSTEGYERQVRTIKDQIADCRALARRNGLQVVGKPYEERKSAKVSKKRPVFSELLKQVKKGEIDGIISWHPDRLSRNMLEGSILIDMLNLGQLKDLRFHSLPFSNDPAGRMMLAMMFVLATHYSDDLSQKATRGVRHKFEEGGLGGYHKLGYIQEAGYYQPDTENNNFGLIQQAWKMRAEGKGYLEIAEYLNSSNFSQIRKGKRSPKTINKNTLSRMFSDSFYYGMAVQAGQTTNLIEMNPNFSPITDEETFAIVQEVGRKRKPSDYQKLGYFLPCRDIIYCHTCHDTRPMTVYRAKSKSGKYFVYMKCKNTDCSRKPKDVRAKVLMGAVSEALADITSRLSDGAYNAYLQETKELSSSKKTALRGQNTSLQAQINRLEKLSKSTAETVKGVDDERMKARLQAEISNNMNEIDKAKSQVAKNNELLSKTRQPRFSKEEFNQLVQEMSLRFEKGSIVQQDLIIRNVFLNLEFDGTKITNALLKEPFATLLGGHIFSLGRGGGNRTPECGFGDHRFTSSLRP